VKQKKKNISLKSLIRINNKPKIQKETRLKLSLRSHSVSVEIFDKNKNFLKEFPTRTSVGKYFNVSTRTIGRYLDKDTKYNDFRFKSKFKNN